MSNVDDADRARLVVDAVDHAVGAPTGTVSILQRGMKPLAHTVGVVQQRANEELVGGRRNRLRESLGELTPGCGGDDEE